MARFEFEGLVNFISPHTCSYRTIAGSYMSLIGHKSASHGNIKINIDGQPSIANINAWGDARAPSPFQKLFEHRFLSPGSHCIEVASDLSGAQVTTDVFA